MYVTQSFSSGCLKFVEFCLLWKFFGASVNSIILSPCILREMEICVMNMARVATVSLSKSGTVVWLQSPKPTGVLVYHIITAKIIS